jgi:hypothetical protein
MEQRLGGYDLHIPAPGFGAWALGGAGADEVAEMESFVRGARLPHGEQHA